ncbi:MAG: acyl-CoA thioesterase [Tannerella sp.]|jgi:acyl-CoA thioester hydrolase|nr:acyl-CoA thioesterase [Tannerella sp.]
MKDYLFKLEMKVRDYECDLQGVVNNANYQRYMEHTRHEFMGTLGKNFGEMHDEGVDAFVSKVEIRYRHSLRSGDRFLSCMNLRREGVKLIFDQDIIRSSDNILAASGRIETVIVENGKLTRGDYFDKLINFQ